jgi:type VI protein secretion system component VasA
MKSSMSAAECSSSRVIDASSVLYSSVNSFNQMVMRSEQREEDIKRFLRGGEQELM